MEFPEQFNAATYFVDRHILEGRSDRVAFECGDEQVTYAQLLGRVNSLANALRNTFSVRIEERVLLLLLDTPDFAYSFFAAMKIGAVPVPVNTLLRVHEYEHLLNDSRARVVIVSESLMHLIQQIPRRSLAFLQHLIVSGRAANGTQSLSDLLVTNAPELEAAPTCKDDAAFWLYSSGSTGLPKACIHLHHDMVVTAELYARRVLNITESDRFFSVAKLFFAYGLGNGLYFSLAIGATSILLPGPPSPENVYAIIERHRPTLFFSVPSNYAAMLAARRESKDFDLSSVRCAVSAGEALPPAIFHRFKERFGIEILDAIGSTEALHMFISNRPGAVRPGSSGQVIPGCEVKLLNNEGQAVPVGEMGTLWVKSDAVCSGYWNKHEKTKETISGHWICTGDKFREDDDGYFWYEGRSDDMLKVSGVWVSPAEIESVLMENDAVQEVAVVARRDKDDLWKPAAWVVLRNGFQGTSELARSLQEFVVTRLPVYKRPRWVEFVSEVPKTATGKIQRFKLRQEAGATVSGDVPARKKQEQSQ